MGFRTIAQIPFLNVSEAKVIKMHEHNQSILSFGNGFSTAFAWQPSSMTAMHLLPMSPAPTPAVTALQGPMPRRCMTERSLW